MADLDREKDAAARRSLDFVEDGMVVGLGTGTTARYAIERLGARVRDGWRLQGVPTSETTAALARQHGIPLVTLEEVAGIDVTIDGADEVLATGDAIKGAGGALVREKIVATASRRVVFIVDARKLVPRLGAQPLPVEVVPFGWPVVQRALAAHGFDVTLRRDTSGAPFRSDNGNHILDARLRAGAELPDDATLRAIVGVVDHGLFRALAHHVVVGRGDEVEVIDCARSVAAPRAPHVP